MCEIMPDGMPPARCGNLFVAVHPGAERNDATRNLDEYFGFNLTLTMRVSAPRDRVGDQVLASKLARTSTKGNPSFNARLEQLRAWGHTNWKATVLSSQTPASANDNLVAWAPAGTSTIYGFVEPAKFTGRDAPVLVGPDWFNASPEGNDVGLKAELRFDAARRMQPYVASSGSFI